MLTDVEAVIFDVDGTLLDSMWVWTEVDRIYIEKYNLVVPDDFHKAIEGMSFTETAQYFLDTFSTLHLTIDEVKTEWVELSRELYRTKVELKPGAEAFLKRMYEKEIPLGIATSNTRQLVEEVLKALHVDKYFSVICTACEVKAGKPAPDVYLKAAEELHVRPENCLVFEDVPNGILAGKNAGMRVCAVDDVFSRPYETEKRQLADYYIHDYSELCE